MGLISLGAAVLGRLRLSALVPRLEVAVEGEAHICTRDHVPIHVVGAPERLPIQAHLDVWLHLWNKGHGPVALLEVRKAAAAGQKLETGTAIGTGSFTPCTLEPARPKVESHFCLRPADGSALAASNGDRVEFGLRVGRNSRDRRVTLEIGETS